MSVLTLPHAPGPKVLVVDDDPDHRALTLRRLRGVGIEARAASTGEQALAILSGVDLVLLDHHLPGASGLEVLARLTGDEGPSVVMVTGAGSEELVAEAMRAGALDYVVKGPQYLASLPAVVERAWRHHELARRANRLQELTLLVTRATDRDEVCGEIVRGARELLDASSCALVLEERELELVAQDGQAADLRHAIDLARRALDTHAPADDGSLLVPLSATAGELVGVLVVMRTDGWPFSPEESRLAEVFASFAGLALERMRRLELERALVAELQRTVDQRQSFMAATSHELRTPLTCILGFTETLLRRWEEFGEDGRRDLVARVGHHAADLRELVENMLDFAARQRGREPGACEEVALRQAVSAAIEDLAPMLADRPVRVEVVDAVVRADPYLLARVLSNLLSNAVKYSAVHSPVLVRATAAGPHRMRVEVVDRGVGLPPEETARVFEPFWRGRHATANAARGTGIGLALVKEYVTSMGGDVAATSSPGVGSTFSFTLPLVAAPTRPPR